MAERRPASVMTPKKPIAAVRYLIASSCERDMPVLLVTDLDPAEMDRKSVGVDRRHPFEIGDRGHGFVAADAEVRHLPFPSGVFFRFHEEGDHRLLLAAGAGNRLPGVPGRIEP